VVADKVSKPILEERPYLNQILNLQKTCSELDLQLHKQLTGAETETLPSTRLIDKILAGTKLLNSDKVLEHTGETQYVKKFSDELRRLKLALTYYRVSRDYDSTSSSSEELFEIIDESTTKINRYLNILITRTRSQIYASDQEVLNSTRFIQKSLLFFLAIIVSGTIVVIFVFNKYISTNLTKLINGTIQLGDGNFEWRIKSRFNDEFGKLSTAFNNMAQKIAESKQEIFSQAEKLTKKNIQLKKEEQRAQNYLDIAGVMMVALDENGQVTLINKKACEMLNVTEEEAIGVNWFDRFLPKEIVGEIKGVFNKLIAGEHELVEFYENKVLTSDGRELFIAFHNNLVVNEQGEIAGVFFSGEDITARRRAESEQEKLKEQIRQVQKMEAIGTMAGGIAHDFNNILTAILGYAEFVKNEIPESGQAQEDIDQILKAGNRAKGLIGQILTFSRQEKMELMPIYPQVIIKETMKLLRSTIPTTVSIIQNISEDCGKIKADPTGIHQILINLVTNSVHAMDDKGVLAVSLKQVNLKAYPLRFKPDFSPGTYVRLSISDSGAGMDPKTIERIFDPFFTTKEVGEGTGMGLAVVYGIVENHGGFIDVESEPGRGSTFHVFFPVTEEEDIFEIEKAKLIETGTERILLVDDEKIILDLAERMLTSLGYEVTAETSSEKALEIFKASPDQFELVISDLAMPDISGTELKAEILKIRPDMPVIICTGYDSKVTPKYAGEQGVTEYIKKPFDKIMLSEVIRKVLDGKV